MKVIDIKNCSTDLHFPITQAVPSSKPNKKCYKRIINFATYRREFQVMEDYCLWVPSLAKWIFIPKGFIFDGASVPKILNSLYSPTGMLLLGALPHDFGYRYEGLFHVTHEGVLVFATYTKKELDFIFKSLCSYESNMVIASSIATGTLGGLGFLGWNSNRKAHKVLTEDFPELFDENMD